MFHGRRRFDVEIIGGCRMAGSKRKNFDNKLVFGRREIFIKQH